MKKNKVIILMSLVIVLIFSGVIVGTLSIDTSHMRQLPPQGKTALVVNFSYLSNDQFNTLDDFLSDSARKYSLPAESDDFTFDVHSGFFNQVIGRVEFTQETSLTIEALKEAFQDELDAYCELNEIQKTPVFEVLVQLDDRKV